MAAASSKHADVDAKNNEGKMPLHMAADTGNKDIMELLRGARRTQIDMILARSVTY